MAKNQLTSSGNSSSATEVVEPVVVPVEEDAEIKAAQDNLEAQKKSATENAAVKTNELYEAAKQHKAQHAEILEAVKKAVPGSDEHKAAVEASKNKAKEHEDAVKASFDHFERMQKLHGVGSDAANEAQRMANAALRN